MSKNANSKRALPAEKAIADPAARKPPVHIPLTFDTAIDGLLRVKPKKTSVSAEKAPAATKAPKKKGTK